MKYQRDTVHKCSKEEMKQLRKRSGQILLRKGETDTILSFWMQILVFIFTITEVAVIVVFFHTLFEKYSSNSLLISLLLFILGTTIFFSSKVIFGVGNMLFVHSLKSQMKKRYFWQFRDVTINGAQIVKSDGATISYVEDGVFDEIHRPILIKENFEVDIRVFNKQSGRLALIRGKDRKGKERLQVMLADDLLAQYIGTYNPKAHKKRNLNALKSYPHCNGIFMNGKREVLQREEKTKLIRKYRKYWINMWAKRIGCIIFAVTGIILTFLYLMYDNQEITANVAKSYSTVSVGFSVLLFLLLMIMAFVIGKKKIVFDWKKEVIFAGLGCEEVKHIGKVTVIKVYEQNEEEFVLKSYKKGTMKYDFQYGEIIYQIGNDKEKYYFCER